MLTECMSVGKENHCVTNKLNIMGCNYTQPGSCHKSLIEPSISSNLFVFYIHMTGFTLFMPFDYNGQKRFKIFGKHS